MSIKQLFCPGGMRPLAVGGGLCYGTFGTMVNPAAQKAMNKLFKSNLFVDIKVMHRPMCQTGHPGRKPRSNIRKPCSNRCP